MKKYISAVLLSALILCAFCGCSLFKQKPLKADEDEVKVHIRLDLKEDIGLLLVNYSADGRKAQGGISNANKTMLKKNSDDLDWSLYKEFLDTPADTADLTLKFTVVTKYFEPNYDNDYPEEYMIPMNDISFAADFGKIYYVTITGDKAGGYHAVLNGT